VFAAVVLRSVAIAERYGAMTEAIPASAAHKKNIKPSA